MMIVEIKRPLAFMKVLILKYTIGSVTYHEFSFILNLVVASFTDPFTAMASTTQKSFKHLQTYMAFLV